MTPPPTTPSRKGRGDKSPVITIDGPGGSGKGTAARLVANRFAWHLLDSGALYRLTAVAARAAGLEPAQPEQQAAAATLARSLEARFTSDGGGERILLSGKDVTAEVRAETTGDLASQWAAIPAIRQALLDLQHGFRQPPGLVADGRDMGTVVFPDATLKIFLEASVAERAQRRLKQLNALEIPANIDRLCSEISARDQRDRERSVSPLRPAAGAVVIDSSQLTAAEVATRIEALARERNLL